MMEASTRYLTYSMGVERASLILITWVQCVRKKNAEENIWT
jgi:hypothetical protein